MTSLQLVNFYQLVQVERLETSSKERSQNKKFSRGASSSSGKRARESLAQLEYSLTTRGRRQGSNVAPSSGRGALVGHGEIRECPHCHRRNLGVYRLCRGPAPFFAYLGLMYDENDLASCAIFLHCFRRLDRLLSSPPLDQERRFCFSF